MLGLGLRAGTGLGGLATALLMSRSKGEESLGHQAQDINDGMTNLVLNDQVMGREISSQGLQYREHNFRPIDVTKYYDEETIAIEEWTDEYEEDGVLDLGSDQPNEQGRQQAQAEKMKAAVAKARNLCWVKMYESGTPGMVVAISVNGKPVWQHGFGYADLENNLLVGTGCIMRIASISKPLTMAVLGRLWEEGKVDLDSSVRNYVPQWPIKTIDGAVVDITLRQLCCHLSGVRHYDKKEDIVSKEGATKDEFDLKEYYIRDYFKTTDESLALFKDDELLCNPGTQFNYTTHGFTLLAKVIENVTGQPFDKYMESQFKELGLSNTYLDKSGPLIANRANYYVRDKYHRLRNAPYVDNSYKWAGGGFLSSVGDLIRFGSAMLYSYQQKSVSARPKISGSSSSKTAPPHEEIHKDPSTSSDSEKNGPDPPSSESAKSAAPSGSVNTSPSISTPAPSDKPDEEEDENPQIVPDKVRKVSEDSSAIEMKDLENVENVEYRPGPFSSVNNMKPSVRYLPGILRADTVAEMWKPQAGTSLTWGGSPLGYGLGWAVRTRAKVAGFARDDSFYVSHTGGAVGASSVLLIAPGPVKKDVRLPQGVVVAILCNMQGVGLNQLAADISKCFEGLEVEKPVKVMKIYQC